MIRLRTDKGQLFPLPPSVAAVELCSTDGKIARVLLTNQEGKIILLGPGDKDFTAYVRAVKADVAEIININS